MLRFHTASGQNGTDWPYTYPVSLKIFYSRSIQTKPLLEYQLSAYSSDPLGTIGRKQCIQGPILTAELLPGFAPTVLPPSHFGTRVWVVSPEICSSPESQSVSLLLSLILMQQWFSPFTDDQIHFNSMQLIPAMCFYHLIQYILYKFVSNYLLFCWAHTIKEPRLYPGTSPQFSVTIPRGLILIGGVCLRQLMTQCTHGRKVTVTNSINIGLWRLRLTVSAQYRLWLVFTVVSFQSSMILIKWNCYKVIGPLIFFLEYFHCII